MNWGFPKIRGTLLGVPIKRTIIFWGLYWGPPILGNYQILLGIETGRFGTEKLLWVCKIGSEKS